MRRKKKQIHQLQSFGCRSNLSLSYSEGNLKLPWAAELTAIRPLPTRMRRKRSTPNLPRKSSLACQIHSQKSPQQKMLQSLSCQAPTAILYDLVAPHGKIAVEVLWLVLDGHQLDPGLSFFSKIKCDTVQKGQTVLELFAHHLPFFFALMSFPPLRRCQKVNNVFGMTVWSRFWNFQL